MHEFNWLINFGDFLKSHQMTPQWLLFFMAVIFIALIFSLRELVSWLAKTSGLFKQIQTIHQSQKTLEQKMDLLTTLHLNKIMPDPKKQNIEKPTEEMHGSFPSPSKKEADLSK